MSLRSLSVPSGPVVYTSQLGVCTPDNHSRLGVPIGIHFIVFTSIGHVKPIIGIW